MSTAHLLSGLDDCEARLDRIRIELGRLGWTVRDYGKALCDKTRIDNTESQLNTNNAIHTSFADVVLPQLNGLPRGDVIIATAPWHWRIFKGLLGMSGYYDGTPVVEVWINYRGSFARWRIFSSYFMMGYAMGQVGMETANPDWMVAEMTAEAVKDYMEQLPNAGTRHRP